jgi:hypothetical protein
MTIPVPRSQIALDPLIDEAKRRMRRRRLFLVSMLALAAAGTAAVVVTRPSVDARTSVPRSRWHATQTCATGGAAVTGGLVSSRANVSMSLATAKSIAQRTGPSEFAPAGTHSGTAQAVPCMVALSAAFAAGDKWGVSHQHAFAVTAGWVGYASGPQFSFHCVLQGEGARTLLGTCSHRADVHAGSVKVTFRIRRVVHSA